jgi:hypothetical protein
MQVSLEAIKFNHDPDSATSDALNIRRNETDAVTVPEWRKGLSILPDDSPAVYAFNEIGNRQITIQAKFKCVDPERNTVGIRAIDPTRYLEGRADNVLGEVAAREITFDSTGETQFESFELDCVDLGNRGVSSSVTTWIWQYRVEDSDWCVFATTRHRIYTILELPKCAWVQQPFDGRNPQLPWTEVLDYACKWARGARDLDEAAARITQAVFDLGKSLVGYDGPSSYADENFDCSSFLSLLQDDKGLGQRFNCTDCATIVSTFANAVGCDLWQSRIRANFTTHPIRLIGASSFKPEEFNFHEVAWKDECSFNDDLFDACLELDGDPFPGKPPHEPVLAIQTKFGTAKEGDYRFRLAPRPPRNEPDACHPSPQERRRRPIGLNTQAVAECSIEISDSPLKDQASAKRPVDDDSLSTYPDIFTRNTRIGLWELYRVRYLKRANLDFGAYSLWFLPNGDPEHLIRVDLYDFATPETATREKQRLLDRYQMTGIKKDALLTINSVNFINVSKTAFLWQFGRVVAEVRSVGRKEILKIQNFVEAFQADQLSHRLADTDPNVYKPKEKS